MIMAQWLALMKKVLAHLSDTALTAKKFIKEYGLRALTKEDFPKVKEMVKEADTMHNVPIKFRGKRIDTGEYVFGDLLQGVVTKIVNSFAEYFVDKESVAELAGYDENGNEVYKSRSKLR